jgi:FMN phosphatase YigB (HAD superfamily)
MTQALSLDFWGTLAVFNPRYTAARTAYLAGLAGISEPVALARYQSVKRRLDNDAELFGAAVLPSVAYRLLLEDLRLSHSVTATELQRRIEAFVYPFPPLMTARTEAVLRLAADAGLVLCLSSNTNFISGALLTGLFADLPFHCRVYSDEVGVSKPHPDFFRAAFHAIRRHRPRIRPGEITHIGDHPVCDLVGAEQAGMTAVLVRSPDDTVASIETILTSIRKVG